MDMNIHAIYDIKDIHVPGMKNKKGEIGTIKRHNNSKI
jgi:hypothetical protein